MEFFVGIYPNYCIRTINFISHFELSVNVRFTLKNSQFLTIIELEEVSRECVTLAKYLELLYDSDVIYILTALNNIDENHLVVKLNFRKLRSRQQKP